MRRRGIAGLAAALLVLVSTGTAAGADETYHGEELVPDTRTQAPDCRRG